MKVTRLFKESIKLTFTDKFVFLYATLPVLIGVFIYYFSAKWIYGTLLSSSKEMISKYIHVDTLGVVLYYLISILATLGLIFIINWTFILLISTIATPFNALLSERIESIKINTKGSSTPFSEMLKKLPGIYKNEVKKILSILILTIISFIISFIPVIAPVALLLTGLLTSIQFLDYSWSRHDQTLKMCTLEIRKNIMSYIFFGIIFMLFISIPILSLIALPIGVTFFTLVWLERKRSTEQE